MLASVGEAMPPCGVPFPELLYPLEYDQASMGG